MADFSNIIQKINEDITTNGVGAITGAKLNEVLRDMIAAVNAEKQDPLTIDAIPTENSTNPVQSGGVEEALGSLYRALSVAKNCLFGGYVEPNDEPHYGDDHRYYYLAKTEGRYTHFNNYEVDNYIVMFLWYESTQSWRMLTLWPNDQTVSEWLQSKQDTIQDLSEIRSGAALGATAYQKPSGGVPESDLASSVQTSLSKADTAIQSAEFNELEEEIGTIGNGAYEEAWDGSSAPVVADIPAGVSVTYNSTSYTGTLAASASTVDKIYLVSDGNGNYDRYVTIENSGTYSWKKVGTTAIPLSDYATKTEVSQLEAKVIDTNVIETPVTLTVYSDGYYAASYGTIQSDSTRRRTDKISVTEGEKYLVTTKIGSSMAIAYLAEWNGETYVGVASGFTGGSGNAVDREYIVPSGVTKIAICSYNTTEPSLKKVTTTSEYKFYTKTEADAEFATIEQVEDVDDKVADIEDVVMADVDVDVPLTLTLQTGYYRASDGVFVSEDGKKCAEITVSEGQRYKISSYLKSTVIALIVEWDANNQYIRYVKLGTGTGENVIDYEYTVPSGVAKIGISNANYAYDVGLHATRVDTEIVPNVYTKEEIDNGVGKYGVKWSVTDSNDLGSRTFSSIGKTASIGVGNTNGKSDFDGIWPWSGMKRCNIKTNANGASIVTFEGETGFTLDGSNGDVFVRIPKFKTDHYVENGYEYVVIGDGYVHPAFIEDGVELDEIFVGAFEASIVSNALYSKAGIIPANNLTAAEFLAAAKARGSQYTLADMRSVDAIWRLMAVEYGNRNSNRVIGYGYADFFQAATYQTWSFIAQAATGVNTVTCGNITSASLAAEMRSKFAAGNTICICDTDNTTIVAERIITSVTAENGGSLSITFDGDPIDVTTSMFVGNAPALCNYCETINASYKLNWHTGRANRPPVFGAGLTTETMNPCRYRWIENPVGNVWQFLPDVTFVDRQMYVCKSMKDYEMFKNTAPYVPVGPILPKQNSNGNKSDVNSVARPNYWITGLLLDIFAKGNNFGKSFDTVHDGTILSTKGYGGYYYLSDGTVCIVNGGGFDHLWRCNMLTNRAWIPATQKWYLYGARLMFKNI